MFWFISKFFYVELIPKLKIESPNFKFPKTSRVFDYEDYFEILFGLRNKIGFGMGSIFGGNFVSNNFQP